MDYAQFKELRDILTHIALQAEETNAHLIAIRKLNGDKTLEPTEEKEEKVEG